MEGRRERETNFVTDLTLGLVETLQGLAGVQDVSVVSRVGVERAAVMAWEQRNNVAMPQALKSLYMASDGFKLTWNYSTAGKVLPLGNMEVHPLARVNRLGTGRGSGDPLAPSITDLALAEDPVPMSQNSNPRLTPRSASSTSAMSPPTFHTSKMFEIDSCQGFGRVVVGFPGRGENFPEGSYWFVDLSLRPHLLAIDTHTYWRLMLVHLGMPQWQALVSGQGLTPWARQWYEVVAGYLLEGARPPRPAHQTQDHVNRLDWSVFKNKKTHHKTKGSKDTTKDSAAKETATKDTGKPKE